MLLPLLTDFVISNAVSMPHSTAQHSFGLHYLQPHHSPKPIEPHSISCFEKVRLPFVSASLPLFVLICIFNMYA